MEAYLTLDQYPDVPTGVQLSRAIYSSRFHPCKATYDEVSGDCIMSQKVNNR